MSTTDWMPTSNDGKRQMCYSWINYAGKEWERLEIPEARITVLSGIYNDFMHLHMMPPEERTPVIAAELKMATKKLEDAMRLFKRQNLFSPPLEDKDYIGFGLKIPDSEPTPVAAPLGSAEADIMYLGGQQLELHFKHTDGTPVDHRAEHGIKIYFDVFDANDSRPLSGKELKRAQFTRHKKFVIRFEPEDIGKRVYFCLRYENAKGEAGPWGSMISAIIP